MTLQKRSLPIRMMVLHTAFNYGLILMVFISSTERHYLFLGWNLFLAWIPLLLAFYLKKHFTLKWGMRFYIILGIWLLFFPNAPYIITDLIHLNERYNPAAWYDILLLFSSALNGLLLGFYSLYLVHNKLRVQLSERMTWLLVFGFSVLSGYGIYLGRVLRWNSWDLFVHPITLVKQSLVQLTSFHALSMTIGFSSFIIMLYYVFKTIINYESSTK
ncbi:MAG: putative membrane protein [Bacteroidia bacterium]|jgi:uncharacterized membrane protein